MRRPTGYAIIVEPERRPVEYDTTTCSHCQRAIFTKPGTASTVYLILDRSSLTWREEMGAFCRVCMRPVCLPCHAQGSCTPWERQMEISERRDRLCRSIGIG